MNEVGELPQKEQVVVPPELGVKMAEATQAVKEGMAEPAADIAESTQQLGMFAELWQVQKEFGVKKLGIMFKDLKAALGIIPFIPKISEWNTARIASKPIEKLGESAKEARAAIAAKEATLSHAVETVGAAGNLVAGAEREVAILDGQIAKLTKKNLKKPSDTKISADLSAAQSAREIARQKVTASRATWETRSATFETTMQERMKTMGITLADQYNRLTDKAKRGVLKSLGLPLSDEQMIGRWDQVSKHFAKTTAPPLHDRLQVLGNGDMPARTKWEARGRTAKGFAKNVILRNLGPIIDPAPDVPGLVVMGSWGAELLGQPWFGLIPPVWQYAHNRYEDFTASLDMSKKATEIVKRHWDKKFGKLKEPEVAKAAEAFVPTPVKTAV